MDWLMRAGALAMGLFPVAFLYWYTRRPVVVAALRERLEDADGLIARQLRLALGLTVLGLAALGAYVLLAGPETAGPALIWGPIVLFHGVWWPAVTPLLARSEGRRPRMPGDLAGAPETSRRAATLTPREERDYLPGWWWAAPIVILLGGLGVLVRTAAGPGIPQPGAQLVAIICPLAALSFFAGYGWWARFGARSPQDLGGAVDPAALAEAYDRFRRFLVRGVFAMMVAAVAVFMGAAVAIVLAADRPGMQGLLGAWIGGGGGTLLGVLGGVFGTMCSLKRMHLERLRRHGPGGAGSAAHA